MPDLLEPLSYGFVQRALLGATLVAIACASVGVFVVLRGLAFLGDAVAHIAFPGVVIAFMLKTDLVIGGSIAAIGGALAIGLVGRRSGLREDTIIGIVFSGMFALGIVLFSTIRAYTGDLLGALLGDVLGISAGQLWLAALTALFVVVVLWLVWKEIVFVSFDPTGAAAAGLPVARYDALLLVLVGLAIAISIQIVGVVLVVALLVTPAATARLIARKLQHMLFYALLFAGISALAGIYASYYLNTASGGTIVLVATALFVVVWVMQALGARTRDLTAVRG
ncbi:MAG: metal ABC transporter permease [Chloroflexi bacterium]|nr:metal ABC transporter permease [Chloroflexota bacterium]